MKFLAVILLLAIAVSGGVYYLYGPPKPLPQQHAYTMDPPPPSYLLIRGERWYVDPVKDLDHHMGVYALTDCDHRYILYESSLQNPILRESVWHEISHAELCGKKYTNEANWHKAIDGEEHDVIYPLSMAQISFMHDNPEFMKWMENW